MEEENEWALPPEGVSRAGVLARKPGNLILVLGFTCSLNDGQVHSSDQKSVLIELVFSRVEEVMDSKRRKNKI